MVDYKSTVKELGIVNPEQPTVFFSITLCTSVPSV